MFVYSGVDCENLTALPRPCHVTRVDLFFSYRTHPEPVCIVLAVCTAVACSSSSLSAAGPDQCLRQARAMQLMSDYVVDVASHYIHLSSSDVIIPSHYVDTVRHFVHRETRRRQRLTTWSVLELSTSRDDDFLVGVLLHSAELRRFASFFLAFSSCHNQTLSLFLDIVTQKVSLVHRPPVFRRRDDIFIVDDDDMTKPWSSADDPPATVLSSMRPVPPHTADLVYASDAGYFQSSLVVPGDWIALVFDADVTIKRILVRTGLPDGSQTLRSGFIELSPRLLKLDRNAPSVVCADFVRVGEVVGKLSELDNVVRSVWGRTTRCLQLTVADAASQVVFHQIAVLT